MLRIASQYIFCSPQQILSRMVVEQDEQNVITRLFGLDDCTVESSQTLFFDGIISIGIVSLKQNLLSINSTQLLENYNYIDCLLIDNTQPIIPTDKPLLLDFGSEIPDAINKFLPNIASVLSHFSVFEIIAACTYYPSLFLKQPVLLENGRSGKLQLWENVDLPNKKLTEYTRIRQF